MRRTLPIALLVGLLVPTGAHAVERSPAAVAELAARALHNPGALAQLRATTSVNGRPVALAAALDAAGPALRARLLTLAAGPRTAQPGTTLASPQAAARAILGQRRFHGTAVPRPLHRQLSWLGGELHRVSRRLDRVYRSLLGWLPGGAPVFWTVAAALLAAAAALAAWRLGRRRAGRVTETRAHRLRDRIVDPARLEHEAERAERAGDYALALRLRFQAGLLRLIAVRAIPAREQLTNGEIARLLASPSFRRVAGDFDEVVYGGRAASGADARRASEGWTAVLDEVPRR